MKSEHKQKKNIKLVLVNLAAMVLVVVLIPYLVLLWLDAYTRHGESYKVPDVCGMQLDDAKQVLRKSNLDLEIVDYKYKQGASENEIVEQSPVAGSDVKEGRKIMLVMNSTSRPLEIIPSVIDNCSLREAEARLEASGFVVENIVTRKGEKDWVYAIKYNDSILVNGSSVPRGAGLTLIIGRGEENDINEVVVDEGYFE